MGRITVFSIDGCPHCFKAKRALEERGFPYTEINLSSYPDKRSDMLTLTDSLTVPQVFFNERHIGGAVETVALLTKWEKDWKKATGGGVVSAKFDNNAKVALLKRFNTEVARQADPSDPRLQPSTKPPITIQPPLPRSSEVDDIPLPGDDKTRKLSVVETTQWLMKVLPRHNILHYHVTHQNCFRGSQAIKALLKNCNNHDKNEDYAAPCLHIKTKQDAIDFMALLQDRYIIFPVHHSPSTPTAITSNLKSNYPPFKDSRHKLYRLAPFQFPNILNSYRVWTDRVDPNPHNTLSRMSSLMNQIKSSSQNHKTGKHDLKQATQHPSYPSFEEQMCEFQKVDLHSKTYFPTLDSKVAFIINLYNLLIKYAHIKIGIPVTNFHRASYFHRIAVHLGNHIFSLNDLENGILRGNRPAPYTLGNLPFASNSKQDPRIGYALSMEEVDERIHFGLNCGAASCPPVKKFTTLGLREELRIVAAAFCESGVILEEDRNVVRVSRIFQWYSVDFVKACSQKEKQSNKDSSSNLREDSCILKMISTYLLKGEKKETLDRMIENDSSSIRLKYLDYDWGHDASDFKVYQGYTDILSNKTAVNSFLSFFF